MAPNPPFTTNEIPGSTKLNAGAYAYVRSTSTVDVVNTTTETDLFSQSITAGHMSSDRMLRLFITGDMLSNTGGSYTFTPRFKFGGTTIWADTSVSVASAGATRMPFRIGFELMNLGAANSQFASGWVEIGDSGAATTGIGDMDLAFATTPGIGFLRWPWSSNGLLTIDTAAAAQTIAVSMQFSVAHASLSWRKRYALLELI